MGKPLTAARNSLQQNLNNSNTTRLSVRMSVKELSEHLDSEFVNLFSHTEETASHLAQSFLENGYDESQPVHYAYIEDEDKSIVIDGMTRLHALRLANFFDVPVFKHTFKNRMEALMYAYRLQLDRRNLDDAQKLAAIEKMIEINPRSKDGSLAKYISATLNMGERNVKKAINILKNADEETKQAVFNHEITINQGDKETQKKKNASRKNSFKLKSEPFWEGFENLDKETKEEIVSGKKKFSEAAAEQLNKQIFSFWDFWKTNHQDEDISKEEKFFKELSEYISEN